MFKVRVIGQWAPQIIEFEGGRISREYSPSQADALLCVYRPEKELLNYRGPKAWYCFEPFSAPTMGATSRWPRQLGGLSLGEQLYHSHPWPSHRIPIITHWGPLSVVPSSARWDRAVGVTSNHGGMPWVRWPDIQRRNRFLLEPRVDLYGHSWRWFWYDFPRPGHPGNYRGPIPGSWGRGEKLDVMARYKVAICLENSHEPFYLTEKFVDAVRAGCIPIYHAHGSLRAECLNGARWVDPAEFDFDCKESLDYALSLSQPEVAAQNLAWLASSPHLALSEGHQVFARIGRLLRDSSL